MSAPGASAGTAAGNGGNGDGGEAAQQASGEAQQNGQNGQADIAALTQRMDQMAGPMEDMRQFLAEQQGWNGGADAAYDDDGVDGVELGDDVPLDQYMPADPGDVAAQIGESFDAATREAFAEHIAPVAQALDEARQEFGDFRQEVDYQRLVGELPDLADPDVAEAAVMGAHQLAQVMGAPHLGASPHMVRLAYLASRALEMAQQEGADAVDPAHLEGGGGAIAGRSAGSAADQIMGASTKAGSSVLPFH